MRAAHILPSVPADSTFASHQGIRAATPTLAGGMREDLAGGSGTRDAGHEDAPYGIPPVGLIQALATLDPAARANVLAHVQRSAGNRTVQRLLAGPVVQRCTAHSICPECAARRETGGADTAVQGDWLDDAKAAGAAGLAGLSSIAKEAVRIFSCLPLIRAIAIVATVEDAVLGMLVQHVKAGTMPSAGEAQVLLPVVEKALITTVCNCLPDRSSRPSRCTSTSPASRSRSATFSTT
jgi:hypothetical protein